VNETVLQFGAGNFLRGFVDFFIDRANRNPETALGRIVVVQSTGAERAEALNRAGGRYHLAVQGVWGGKVVEETEEITSISRALHAGTQWGEVLEVARSPHLRWIVSNTTEAGFALDEADALCGPGDCCPHSFPAKLLAVLLARHKAGRPPLAIIPCELIEGNGTRLRALVLEQGARWRVEAEALGWVGESCCWMDNLVETDPLLLSAEPFAFWAIQTSGSFPLAHPAILTSPDIRPYYLRKVRILNGAHSALVAYALPKGIKTVRGCMEDPETLAWLEGLLFEEIVPVLEGQVENPGGFARDTLERFHNPFLEHQLRSIALNHEAKVKVRLRPTLEEFRSRFGREPERLGKLLSADPA
jgi:tagaturonate reductase